MLARLQGVAEQLQNSIAEHSHLESSAAPLELHSALRYAHKIAYTSFAPLGHDPSSPLPQHFRPPNPQEWQLRASQLHQYQAECNQKQVQAQAAATTAHIEASQSPAVVVSAQMPLGLKLPPMPKGWKPGMPIPGLDESLLVGATDPQNAMPSQAVLDSLQPQAASVSTQPAATTDVLAPSINKSPSAELHVQPGAALRPAPFIPDFVLNPSLEAVEEEYSSSDYDEEDV